MLDQVCRSLTNAEFGEKYPCLHVCFLASVICTGGVLNLGYHRYLWCLEFYMVKVITVINASNILKLTLKFTLA